MPEGRLQNRTGPGGQARQFRVQNGAGGTSPGREIPPREEMRGKGPPNPTRNTSGRKLREGDGGLGRGQQCGVCPGHGLKWGKFLEGSGSQAVPLYGILVVVFPFSCVCM